MASASPWEKELSMAQSAILRAARLTKTVLSSVQEVSKADSSPVTIADFAAQALLISILHAEFPDDKFVGEEDSSTLRQDEDLRNRVYELYSAAASPPPSSSSSVEQMLDLIDLGGRGTGGPHGRFWAMDPVDGTATFLTGEQYAVALTLLQDGQEVLAAVVYPNVKLAGGRIVESSVDRDGLGVMLTGVRGHGAQITWLPTLEGPYETRPLPRLPDVRLDLQLDAHVHADADGDGDTEGDGHGATALHLVDCDKNLASHRRLVSTMCDRLGVPFPGTDVWASHIRYAALIIGGGHFLVRIPSGEGKWSCIWDHAGAQLIYREVGGKITDLDGKEVDFSRGRYMSGNRGLVLAREGIHGTILKVAREVVGDGWWA